jgi:hypothetical protein
MIIHHRSGSSNVVERCDVPSGIPATAAFKGAGHQIAVGLLKAEHFEFVIAPGHRTAVRL